MKLKTEQQFYANWLKWFVFSNLLLFYVLGALYFHHLPTHVDALATSFLVFTLFGHLGLLCLLLFLLPLLLLWIWPRHKLVMYLSVILASLASCILFIDVFVFNVFSFHVNMLLLKVIATFNTSEFFGMSLQQTIFAYSFSLLFIALEVGLGIFFWRWRYRLHFKLPFYIVIIVILCCELFSEALYAYAYARGSQSVLQNSRAFPGYVGTQANDFIVQMHLLAKEKIVTEVTEPSYHTDATLHYPLHPLRYSLIKNPPNIVVIGIDAWRADSFAENITPNIYRFAKQASVFHNHFSGGNSTLPGIYTLYYSIPSLYWDATNIPPVFFSVLDTYHYDENVFFSAGMKYPPFYRNVFMTIHGMRLTIPGNQPYQRDAKITDYAVQYLQKEAVTHKPFFMFLFYDAAHSNSLSPSYLKPFMPIATDLNPAILNNQTDPVPYFNLYRDALYYDDHLIGEVLTQLRQLNLLNDTIVVFTSDHGQEFNDNHKNYWGHVSNFTQYQTKVPLIIYLPGEARRDIYANTSHYDLLPTLLQNVFKVKNPLSDYSIGQNLFTTTGWQILPVGSYNYEGLIAPPYIYNFYPLGVAAVYDMHANLQKNFPVDVKALHTYIQYTQTFYDEK